jgi:hypothetical protein
MNTPMSIETAKKMLNKPLKDDDDESYHIKFDKILEKKLIELDPKFMRAMKKLYRNSNMSRWYA